jgi:hypothetical protein
MSGLRDERGLCGLSRRRCCVFVQSDRRARVMKNRISVSGLCFGQSELYETLDRVETLGATATTLSAGKVAANGWDAGVARFTDSPVGVAALHPPRGPTGLACGKGSIV